MLEPIHPFPARMAPEIAFEFLADLRPNSLILDPMCGSGVALRVAAERGHQPIGTDTDPLAVLMARVWTEARAHKRVPMYAEEIVDLAHSIRTTQIPWHCDETQQFARFWFARRQRHALARLALAIFNTRNTIPSYVTRALQLALSRLIITKTRGASLAWDVAHSRPHRVKTADENEFDVMTEFLKSSASLAAKLRNNRTEWNCSVKMSDARQLLLDSGSVDAIITSPPYLNAIDYLRGHRLSLIWLGFSIRDLRRIRSRSIGTEVVQRRRLGNFHDSRIPDRGTLNLVDQYINDIGSLMRELKRVAKPRAKICVITANSTIRAYEVRTNTLVQAVAAGAGLHLIDEKIRRIEMSKRYLPVKTQNPALLSRMMEEHIQYFAA